MHENIVMEPMERYSRKQGFGVKSVNFVNEVMVTLNTLYKIRF